MEKKKLQFSISCKFVLDRIKFLSEKWYSENLSHLRRFLMMSIENFEQSEQRLKSV